jgi:hypothetical protein
MAVFPYRAAIARPTQDAPRCSIAHRVGSLIFVLGGDWQFKEEP